MAGKFELNRSTDNQFYFNFKAANGQTILKSEPYLGRLGAKSGIALVKSNVANDSNYERRISHRNEPHFVLRMANGQIIGTSEKCSSILAMEKKIAALKTNAPDAEVEDLTVQKSDRRRMSTLYNHR